MSVSTSPATLYVVATPIGNLGDIGARAVAVLGQVDLVAAEDTRHTRRLFDHLGIATPMRSLHEHNERERGEEIVARLLGGDSVALVSDAGTPLVSDPGYRLVRSARAAGIKVITVPGPCAAVAALSIAGLPCDRFAFEGFLPARSAARQRRLEALSSETRTMIFYVPPRQLVAQLRDAIGAFGVERAAGLARELTKIHETYYAGTLGELSALAASETHMTRGELVLLVGGAGHEPDATEPGEQWLRELLRAGVALKTAVDIVARVQGMSRNRIYSRALELKRDIDAEAADN